VKDGGQGRVENNEGESPTTTVESQRGDRG